MVMVQRLNMKYHNHNPKLVKVYHDTNLTAVPFIREFQQFQAKYKKERY